MRQKLDFAGALAEASDHNLWTPECTKDKRTCELAIHFNNSEHEISQINFIIIEQIRLFINSLHLDQLLLTRTGLHNNLPFILTKSRSLNQNTALITTIE